MKSWDEEISVPVQELRLDLKQFFVDYPVARDIARNVSMEAMESTIFQITILHFKYQVLGLTLEDKVIKYPKTWWDAFKERWFPDWLKARFPVTYKVHEFRADALYPNLAVQEDSLGREFYYQENREYEEVNID